MDIEIGITVGGLERKLKMIDHYEHRRAAKHVQVARRQLLALLTLAKNAQMFQGSEFERIEQLIHRPYVLMAHSEMRLLLSLALEL